METVFLSHHFSSPVFFAWRSLPYHHFRTVTTFLLPVSSFPSCIILSEIYYLHIRRNFPFHTVCRLGLCIFHSKQYLDHTLWLLSYFVICFIHTSMFHSQEVDEIYIRVFHETPNLTVLSFQILLEREPLFSTSLCTLCVHFRVFYIWWK